MVNPQKLLDSAPVGVVVWTLAGEILFANRSFFDLLGYAASPGVDYWKLTAEGQKQQELNALHGKESRWYEKEFLAHDGERVSVRCRGWALPDEGETFAALVQRLVVSSDDRGGLSARQLRRQNGLLLDLARSEAIDQGELGPALAKITEAAARGMNTARASVWLYDDARSKIVCLDLHELTSGDHSAGVELLARDYPRYFEALAEDRSICADDARSHPATAEFTEGYLIPLGITSMLDAPIRLGGKLVGVLCHEHVGPARSWGQEELAFAGSLADVVSRALEANERRKAELALQKANEELEARVIERTAELKQAVDALWGEMQLARRIQTALVPRSPTLHDFELCLHSTPAAQVGGDYVDVINDGERGWLLVGDASGHGVPAGLVMMMCQTAVRALLAAQPCLDPRSLLIAANRVLASNIEQLGEERYMTLCAVHHQGGGNMVYAGLHLEPMVFRAATGKVELLPSRGMWLGVVPDVSDGTESIPLYLAPGDVLLLYTDGVTEAQRDGKLFEPERLKMVLSRLGYQSASDIGAGILAQLDGYSLDDDVTFLVAKRLGHPSLSGTSSSGLDLGELKIEVVSDGETVTARWLGRSQFRDSISMIGTFLDDLIDQLRGRQLVLDFRELTYMNSSTFVPITRIVRRAATSRLTMSIRYRPALTWQRAPFEMLSRIVGPSSTVKLEADS
jgi:PAS domain S-box-containing protein